MPESVQAERREKELDRRDNRKTAPPLAGVWSAQLVGVTHTEGYPADLLELRETHAEVKPQMLELVREPHNEYDANAIGVWWQGHRIGYLNKVIAFRLAPELDAGVTWLARVEEVEGDDDLIGCSIRCKREE